MKRKALMRLRYRTILMEENRFRHMHKLTLLFLLMLGFLSFAQPGPQLFEVKEIKKNYGEISDLDSLTYVDSSCTLLYNESLYSGYVYEYPYQSRIYIRQFHLGKPTGYFYQFEQTLDTSVFRLTLETEPVDTNDRLSTLR